MSFKTTEYKCSVKERHMEQLSLYYLEFLTYLSLQGACLNHYGPRRACSSATRWSYS